MNIYKVVFSVTQNMWGNELPARGLCSPSAFLDSKLNNPIKGRQDLSLHVPAWWRSALSE